MNNAISFSLQKIAISSRKKGQTDIYDGPHIHVEFVDHMLSHK